MTNPSLSADLVKADWPSRAASIYHLPVLGATATPPVDLKTAARFESSNDRTDTISVHHRAGMLAPLDALRYPHGNEHRGEEDRQWNSEVMDDIEGVLTAIQHALEQPPPWPSPSRGAEREIGPRLARTARNPYLTPHAVPALARRRVAALGRWRKALRHPVGVPAGGRPAAGDRRARRRDRARRARPGAAGRHRLGQDLHHGACHPAHAAPGAHPGAQQDAGGAALWRDEELLPGERGRVFRLLLRLLPAGSLCAALGHLYREGILDQRADRPHAPLGDARHPRAPRHGDRRLGLLHLRHRLGRDLFRDDGDAQFG